MLREAGKVSSLKFNGTTGGATFQVLRSKEQGSRIEDRGARSKEQGARSKEQGARSKEQGARSKEQERKKAYGSIVLVSRL
jgi:hypothetical protein